MSNLHHVLLCLQASSVRLREDKCEFGKTEVTCLGHRIDRRSFQAEKRKLQVVADVLGPAGV